jgi:antitoxin (DNA-binding transcriptional repressor) of toxin-antitoxin stability system
MSKTVAAAEFQEHPLELLEEAAAKQEELVVLKNGKPLGTFVPPLSERPRKTLDEMRAEGVKILGDIMEPVLEWDMTK